MGALLEDTAVCALVASLTVGGVIVGFVVTGSSSSSSTQELRRRGLGGGCSALDSEDTVREGGGVDLGAWEGSGALLASTTSDFVSLPSEPSSSSSTS